jgi:predicted metal-dependent hydrolase
LQIKLDEEVFEIIHRTNKRIKRIGLMIENQNEIVVKTPLGFKANNIREIVESNKEWILRSFLKVPAKNMFDFIHGGTLPFMGKNYPIEMLDDEKMVHVRVKFDENKFLITYNQTHTYNDFMEGLKKLYRKIAKKYIDPIFDELCFKTKLYPENINYRFAKRQWGSCSYKNDISINYMLLQFSKKTIEYVVLHELCHLEEKNHSKRFYNLVSLYMPEYKIEEEKLRKRDFGD